jgi:site-specific recombinase XerD
MFSTYKGDSGTNIPMPRTPKFKWKDAGKRGWVVNIPPTVSAIGKRERCYFATRDEAKTYAQEQAEKYREHGSQAATIRPALAEDATKAAEILKPFGKTLTEAARFYAKSLTAAKASRLTGAAVDAWLASCSELRPRSIKSYKQTGNRIKEALPARNLSTITAAEIKKAVGIENASGSSAAVHYRNARAFWKWSAKEGWCNAELFEKINAPKVKSGKIAVLTASQAEAILRTAEKHFPNAVAHFALKFFAGIREAEINRLEAHDVSTDGIEVRSETSKTDSRRFITPCETLKAWLKKYPFKPLASWDKIEPACRYLAGWKVKPDLADILESHPIKEEFETRPLWPQNAIRHSHATYALETGTDLQTLLFEFGHTESPAILRRHYLGGDKTKKKEALAYFAIMPKGVKAKPSIKVA